MKAQGSISLKSRLVVWIMVACWCVAGHTMAQQPAGTPKQIPKGVLQATPTDSLTTEPEREESRDSSTMANMADSLIKSTLKIKEKPHFQPDPIRSMWLALVFPGGGQIYNRKYWKLPIIYGGYLGCAYALTWNNQMLKDYSQAYLDIMDSDPNTKSYEKMLPMGYDITGKEDRFKEIFKNKKNHFRRFRDMSIFAFAGVFLISVVDAYVDAELSSFDISQDLSLHMEPGMMETYMEGGRSHKKIPAIHLCLNF